MADEAANKSHFEEFQVKGENLLAKVREVIDEGVSAPPSRGELLAMARIALRGFASASIRLAAITLGCL